MSGRAKLPSNDTDVSTEAASDDGNVFERSNIDTTNPTTAIRMGSRKRPAPNIVQTRTVSPVPPSSKAIHVTVVGREEEEEEEAEEAEAPIGLLSPVPQLKDAPSLPPFPPNDSAPPVAINDIEFNRQGKGKRKGGSSVDPRRSKRSRKSDQTKVSNESSGYDPDLHEEYESQWPSDDVSTGETSPQLKNPVGQSGASDLPKLNPKPESYVTALKDYHSNHNKFPSGSEPGFEKAINWAKNYRSQYNTGKLPDNHPVVIRLNAIGWMDRDPAEHIQSGNKAWNKSQQEIQWDQKYDELNDFLRDPNKRGFDALKKSNKALSREQYQLAKWVETNKPKYKTKIWLKKHPEVNTYRFEKLHALVKEGLVSW